MCLKHFIGISIKCVVGQLGNVFILVQYVGFALVLSRGWKQEVLSDARQLETGQINGIRLNLPFAMFLVLLPGCGSVSKGEDKSLVLQ